MEAPKHISQFSSVRRDSRKEEKEEFGGIIET